jgi:ligand-binding sensor domain-containing protein
MLLHIFERFNADRMVRALGAGSLAVFAMLFLTPPASAQQPAGDPAIRHFEVGKEVYVRSLAVDKRRNALWVGTSLGALEIDLATQQVRSTFTRKDGLASEYVFAIGVAPEGDVWFGTNAGGVSVYRDRRWKTYFPMHGLADYWVYSFEYAKDGGVWIGTWNGVNRFDPKTGKFVTYRKELVNIWVYGIGIDPQGRVWFGTEGGVSMLHEGRWRSWTHRDGLGAPNLAALPPSPNTGLGTRERHDLSVTVGGGDTYNPNYVFSVLVDHKRGGIWFGTWGAGVSHFDGDKTWTSYTVRDGLAGNIVYSMAQEPDGTLWFGTNNGVSRLQGKTWRTYRHGMIGRHFYSIAIDGQGAVWLGSKGAVNRIEPGR